jgi:hypothetical protein
MLTNYFHDLAVAVLATNVVMIHIVGRYLDEEPERAAILGRIIQRLAKLTWWALAGKRRNDDCPWRQACVAGGVDGIRHRGHAQIQGEIP